MTPTPRLVPDRPSDAAIAHAFWECGDMPPTTEDWEWIEMRAKQIDAAAPPAEAGGDSIPVSELVALLPGSYYMDPPDGGDVCVLEQLRRMAADATRHRLAAAPAAPAEGGSCHWIVRRPGSVARTSGR